MSMDGKDLVGPSKGDVGQAESSIRPNVFKRGLGAVKSVLRNPIEAYRQKRERDRTEKERLSVVREELVRLGQEVQQKHPPDQNPDFEEKFKDKSRINTKTGLMEVVDVKPENPKTEVPVIMAHGAGATPEVNKELIKKLFENGRRVMSYARPRANLLEQGYFGGEIQRRAQLLITMIEAKGVTKVDAVGHSLGGIDVIVAASLRPELFRNIVLVDPAGMIGKDLLISLPGRQGKEDRILAKVLKSDAQAAAAKGIAGEEFGTYLISSRAIRELYGMTSTKINNLVGQLHAKGIKIAIVHGVDDNVFPMSKVQQNVPNIIDGFYSVKGQHNEIQFHPELYMPVVIHALNNLAIKGTK